MNDKLMRRIFASAVFLISFFVFLMTSQASTSFWDCGEFIASSVLMQVPHPPGTLFFLILGHLFSMLPIAENIAFRVNLISVLASSLTVLFLYLAAVKIIDNFQKGEGLSLTGRFSTYLASAIGALSLSFSTTFWFNGVEAEVYASATFFIGAVTYLIMRWNEKADNPDSEKYILMIAYLIGIATGIHLMAVLAIVPIMMIIFFKKYLTDEEVLFTSTKLLLGHVVLVLVVAFAIWAGAKDTSPPMPDAYKAFDTRFLMIVAGVSAVYFIIFWKKLFQVNSIYLPLFIGGVALIAVYPGMVKYLPKLLYAVTGDSVAGNVFLFIAFIGLCIYGTFWAKKKGKDTIRLISKAVLFLLLGYSAYAMILIRANQDTPINLNDPKTMNGLVKYMSREQYGDFPTFKRRYSQEPQHQGIYTNYSSDLDFFWNYQMQHMFNRYLLWNYVGKQSTVQDSGVNWGGLFGIPFFIGIFGIYYQFRRDWKMGVIFMVMFVFLGWLTAYYQNQQNPQPRERDYFYAGAFFVFSIWIAVGVKGLALTIKEFFKDSKFAKPAAAGTLVLAFIFVPVNMLRVNYHENNRSNNYVPWDYSYNMLQSVAKDAVIFTNGDNDTFPLWYLQDVEGVRRDVRIANLSLLNTAWYIKQLKNTTPHGANKIKMTLSDTQIEKIGPQQWKARKMSIPVPKAVLEKYAVTDTTVLKSGMLTWTMPPSAQFGRISAVRTQDLVALDIIRANNWERPIYFAVTSSDKAKLGLNDYLIMEGMAFRLVPKKRKGNLEYVDEEILKKQLFDEPEGFSKEYQPGFKFRGLNDSTIFFDDNHRRLVGNYRNSFLRLALYYIYQKKDYGMAIKTLDQMELKVPREIIPIDHRLLFDVSNMYYISGAKEKYRELAREVEKVALDRIARNVSDRGAYNPYRLLLDIYQNLKEYNKAADILERLRRLAPNDKQIESMLNRMKRLAAQEQKAEVQGQSIEIDSSKGNGN